MNRSNIKVSIGVKRSVKIFHVFFNYKNHNLLFHFGHPNYNNLNSFMISRLQKAIIYNYKETLFFSHSAILFMSMETKGIRNQSFNHCANKYEELDKNYNHL